MFVIVYKDGHQEHTYNEMDLVALDWSNVVMIINMNNVNN